MKKALIIGVTGQDGAYLAKYLLGKGYEVIGTSRDHELNEFRNLIVLNIKDNIKLTSMMTSEFRSVLNVLQAHQVDEIYNLSGQSSVGKSFDYPIETMESILIGTINILECIRFLKLPVKFYNAGSSEVYGNTLTPATEKTSFNPRSPYATAKASAHYAVNNYREAYSLFACSGILFNHESPLRTSRFVTRKIVSAAVRIANGSNEKLRLGNIDISRDWGWAPDYVQAMWLMLQQDDPEDFIIATGQKYTLENFISKSFDCLGLDWRNHVETDGELFRPLDIKCSYGDPTKAHTKLGWKSTVNFNEIVYELIKAEKNSQLFQSCNS